MTTINKFEDLECWQEARKLTKMIYTFLKDCKDYGFCDQIQRAAVSVMNNIAEGFARTSVKDRIQFFTFAISSLAEVRSMTYLGEDIGRFTPEQANILLTTNQNTSQLTCGFSKYLNSIKN